MNKEKEYFGFLDDKRAKGKYKEELSRNITYNTAEINGTDKDIEATNADYVYTLAANGFQPQEGKSDKGKSIFWLVKDKTKIKVLRSMCEYAKYLIDNGIISEESAENDDDIQEEYNENAAEEIGGEDNIGNSNESVTEDDADDSEEDIAEDKETTEHDTEDDSAKVSEAEKTECKKNNAEKVSQKKDFKLKLKEDAENYSDKKKIALVKQIFEAENGVYDEHSNELLVLIDNFDDAEYKKELTDRLWNCNTASRKVFECISGLQLPITNLEIAKYFAALTKADFKTSKEYTPVTAAEHSKEETFYVKVGGKFEKVKGYPYSEEDMELFIRYTENEVVISDVRTGTLLSKGTNESEAKENLRKAIDKFGADKMKEKLAGLEAYPGYSKK